MTDPVEFPGPRPRVPPPVLPDRLLRLRHGDRGISESEQTWRRWYDIFNDAQHSAHGHEHGTVRCDRCGVLLGEVREIDGAMVLGQAGDDGRWQQFHLLRVTRGEADRAVLDAAKDPVPSSGLCPEHSADITTQLNRVRAKAAASGWTADAAHGRPRHFLVFV